VSDAPPRRLRLPAPKRARRSHADRTAETRARILRAVVESIAEVGFQRTTAAEIARRAGVTWGAVQHHFGGKDGLLVAVVEHSFDRFAERLEDIRVEGTPLEKRAALFVDRAFEHFASPLYRSTFEILLDHLGRRDEGGAPGWRLEMFRAWDGVWMQLFGDAGLPRARHRTLEHFTFAALSGLASALVLEGPGALPRPGELDLLKETLARALARGG